MARAGKGEGAALDRELAHLPEGARHREWLLRIEAVLFASAEPVHRSALARVVGREADVDLLLGDLRAELVARPYDLTKIGEGWLLRTRPAHAAAIRAAAAAPERGPSLREGEATVLAAIAYRQPISLPELQELFGARIDREILTRLRARELIGHGPRSPRPGGPRTWVTTPLFLDVFDLESLADLPENDAFDEPCRS